MATINGMEKLPYARMYAPVSIKSITDAAYFTIKGGHRFKMNSGPGGTELREVINTVSGQLKESNHVCDVIDHDRKGFTCRSWRLGFTWIAHVRYSDVTCYA